MDFGASGTEIRLLGVVNVWVDGHEIALGGPRQRALLAMLALSPGRAVPSDELVEQLWAGEPTDGADTTLRSYVSRLRRALQPAASIARTQGGYALEVPASAVDALEFERLVREAGDALARGAAARARERLAGALKLWRGRPFGDVGSEAMLAAAAKRLEELRLLALERRVEADLAMGESAELVDELEGLVREHPFRERLWRHLMLALYRADRQADALDAYHRARGELDEHLGIEPGEELQQLQAAILRHDVPAANPPKPFANVPAPITSFIGRAAELAAIARLTLQERLVTLTGIGGVGKTRLAVEVAGRARSDYPDGIVFVDLSTITDPGEVPRALAALLEVREQSDRSLLGLLGLRLHNLDSLLILDNCEHVRDAAAEMAASLLASAPGLRVLATSRKPLGVPGEADYAVQPLDMSPDAADSPGGSSDAIALFMARASAINPAIRDDATSRADAGAIVAMLDGLPLAIELAAARAKALSLPDIAARLTDRFKFLVSWRRLGSTRHRTLREAMDWSFDLLSPQEQDLLARLSVFSGGFTAAAVAAVCLAGDEELALARIERLVDASLVVPVMARETRYRLLETVRQYAAERLAERDGGEADHRRHADFYLAVALSANLGIDVEGEEHFDVVRAEEDNIRSAIAWTIVDGDAALGLELAMALHDHWLAGRAMEGLRHFRTLLAAGGDVPPELRGRALLGCGMMTFMSGAGPGTALYHEGLEILDGIRDERGRAHALDRMAIDACQLGDLDTALGYAEASLTLHRKVGNRRGEAQALFALARVAFLERRFDNAIELARASADTAAAAGYWYWQGVSLSNLAEYALEAGQAAEAERVARQQIGIAVRTSDRENTVFGLAVLALAAAEEGRLERAGVLWGAIEAEERRGPIGDWDRQRDDYAAKVPAFGNPTFETARAVGRTMSLEAAIDGALAVEATPSG
jgi:predicted ATPase/DNA-binding SARP family transcriptional activator